MKERSKDNNVFRLHKLSLFSLLVALVIVIRFFTHVVTGATISGDGNSIRATVLIIGKGLLPEFGSCTIINFIAGILISILMPSKEGIFTFLKYLTSGLMLDLLYFILKDYPKKPFLAGIAGMIASLTVLATKLVVYYFVLGFSRHILLAGMGVLSISHGFFGFIFGFGTALIFPKIEVRFKYFSQNQRT